MFEGADYGTEGEARGNRILAGVPRGRGVGFLADEVNSALALALTLTLTRTRTCPLILTLTSNPRSTRPRG